MNAQMKRRGSAESDVIALDVKPSVFVEREEEFFEDGESEVPGGYDVNSDNGYYNGTGDGYEDDSNASMQRDQSYGREEFVDEDSEKSEDEEDTLQQGVQAPGGLWQEDATVSSSLFDNTVGNDAFVAQAPQQPATPVRGKGKEVRIQETSAQPLFSNGSSPSRPQADLQLLIDYRKSQLSIP